jgi:hypothetical protein
MSDVQTSLEFFCDSLDKMRKFSSCLLSEIKDAGWRNMELDYSDRGDEIEITVFFGHSSDVELFGEYAMDCAQLAVSLFAEHFQETHDVDQEGQPHGQLARLRKTRSKL